MLFCKQMIAGSITSKYGAKIQKIPVATSHADILSGITKDVPP